MTPDAGRRAGGQGDRLGARIHRRRRVLRRGRRPLRDRLPGAHLRGRDRRRREDHQRARHRRLQRARAVRRHRAHADRARAQLRQGGVVGALPQRPRPGRGQLARRGARGRAPGRVHDQRPRRARRQRLARGDRHGGAHPRRHLPGRDRHRDHADRAGLQAGVADHRLPGAAQQGHRRRQRLRARVRHPPGRRAQAPRDLRDHARRGRGLGRQQAGARQALRAATPSAPACRSSASRSRARSTSTRPSRASRSSPTASRRSSTRTSPR